MGKSCEKCYRYNEDDNNFCQGCGAPLNQPEKQDAAQTDSAPPPPPNTAVPPAPAAEVPPSPPDTAVSPAPPAAPVQPTPSQDVEKNKIIAVLAYFIFFLPLLVCKDSAFGRFHANQSLVLLLAWIVLGISCNIIPFLGWIILPIGNIVLFVLWIMGIINASNGQMKELPLIGNIVLLK